MTIKKDGDKWLEDVRPTGRDGKRYSKSFDKKSEALAYEKYILAKIGRISQGINVTCQN